MNQNSFCITYPEITSHFSYETPCLFCKNQGIRVKKNFTANMKHFLRNENSWMGDPRYKHENVDKAQSWLTVNEEEEENDDESDIHLEAPCLITANVKCSATIVRNCCMILISAAHFSRFGFFAKSEKNWPIFREKCEKLRKKILLYTIPTKQDLL